MRGDEADAAIQKAARAALGSLRSK